nr:MAG TPA: hypothetical protein [Caudoviricetes sp.]
MRFENHDYDLYLNINRLHSKSAILIHVIHPTQDTQSWVGCYAAYAIMQHKSIMINRLNKNKDVGYPSLELLSP